MPIFEGPAPITYGEFLRQQKGLNDKVMRLQWRALMKELDELTFCPKILNNKHFWRGDLDEEQSE